MVTGSAPVDGKHMNLQPFLTSEMIDIRPLTEVDVEGLFQVASDPLIWEMHPQPDRYKADVFKKFFAEAMASKGAIAILDKKTSNLIGTSRFYDYKPESSSVLIGYTFLSRPYWGGSFNRDLKKLMINHALKFVKTVYFQVGVGNLRSQRAMEKIGAIKTGIEEVAISYGPPKKSYIYKIETPL